MQIWASNIHHFCMLPHLCRGQDKSRGLPPHGQRQGCRGDVVLRAVLGDTRSQAQVKCKIYDQTGSVFWVIELMELMGSKEIRSLLLSEGCYLPEKLQDHSKIAVSCSTLRANSRLLTHMVKKLAAPWKRAPPQHTCVSKEDNPQGGQPDQGSQSSLGL